MANRDLSLDMIRTTILNGRPGTSMPSFKDIYDVKKLGQVMAYALWLASNGKEPTVIVSSGSLETSGSSPAAALKAPSTQPVAIGNDAGIPARGAAVFFDATRFDGCQACHSYRNEGGVVGPDLANGAGTSLQIYRSITQPRVAASNFPAISLSLRNGTHIVGIKGDETADTWQVFDVSSVPPVLRTVRKSEVEVASPKDTGIYDHTALHYSKQDLLDLSAFLAKTESAASR